MHHACASRRSFEHADSVRSTRGALASFLLRKQRMTDQAALQEGARVEMGEPGTPGHRVGVVVGLADAALLGRAHDESAELVAWESGEEEWVQRSLLRPSS